MNILAFQCGWCVRAHARVCVSAYVHVYDSARVYASVYYRKEIGSQYPVDGTAIDRPSAMPFLPSSSSPGRDVYILVLYIYFAFAHRDKLYNILQNRNNVM